MHVHVCALLNLLAKLNVVVVIVVVVAVVVVVVVVASVLWCLCCQCRCCSVVASRVLLVRLLATLFVWMFT